jgi:uncharacterized SAM-binding protein YcdF (DUF218 family)
MSLLRFLFRLGFWGGALGFLALAVWVLSFAQRLERDEPAGRPQAEAIIVLTGGADRIEDGLLLLEAQRAKRLLISGVNPSVTIEAMRKRWPGHDHAFTCCVDLDHSALNTFENAREGAHWLYRHGFRSVIIVTSSYHMPRARLEFAGALPVGTKIHAAPVIADRSRLERWWLDPVLARLVVLESVKFAAAWFRIAAQSVLA